MTIEQFKAEFDTYPTRAKREVLNNIEKDKNHFFNLLTPQGHNPKKLLNDLYDYVKSEVEMAELSD